MLYLFDTNIVWIVQLIKYKKKWIVQLYIRLSESVYIFFYSSELLKSFVFKASMLLFMYTYKAKWYVPLFHILMTKKTPRASTRNRLLVPTDARKRFNSQGHPQGALCFCSADQLNYYRVLKLVGTPSDYGSGSIYSPNDCFHWLCFLFMALFGRLTVFFKLWAHMVGHAKYSPVWMKTTTKVALRVLVSGSTACLWFWEWHFPCCLDFTHECKE